MLISYYPKRDLLYIRFDGRKQQLICERVNDDVTFDIGEDDKIVGIEILDASTHVKLEELLPVRTETLDAA